MGSIGSKNGKFKSPIKGRISGSRPGSGFKRERTLVWKRENTLKGAIPNKPGVYQMIDKRGQVIYVGVAKKLRHRVQSYRQVDDHREHPTKKALRPHIHKFRYKVMPIKDARKFEKKTKKTKRYNFL